jgi:hypothetical protein
MKNDLPAFPTWNVVDITKGMTLRDYFAAAAMSTVILNPWYADETKTYDEISPHLAMDAYTIADAMMEARK